MEAIDGHTRPRKNKDAVETIINDTNVDPTNNTNVEYPGMQFEANIADDGSSGGAKKKKKKKKKNANPGDTFDEDGGF